MKSLFKLGLMVVFGLLVVKVFSGNGQASKPQVSSPKPQYTKDQKQKLLADIEGLKDGGLLYEVNPSMQQARVNLMPWLALSVDEKQGVVWIIHQHFEASGASGRVSILSSQSDEELASYSTLSGVKVAR